MKLMIASPCHGGKCDNTFTLSLISSLPILYSEGIEADVLLPYTGSILSKERNKILWAFMQSTCTHLLCIDSDIGWEPEAPLKLVRAKKDFIGGVYPARTNIGVKTFLCQCDLNENKSVKTENHLLKMLAVPAGFMMLSRECVETMQKAYPNLKYKDTDIAGHYYESYGLFNTEVIEEQMWGEDYVFCKRATDAGINIWCDPTIQFNHAGVTGAFIEILTNKRA